MLGCDHYLACVFYITYVCATRSRAGRGGYAAKTLPPKRSGRVCAGKGLRGGIASSTAAVIGVPTGEDTVSKSEFDPAFAYVFTEARRLPLLPREPDDYIVWHHSQLRTCESDDMEAEEPKRVVACMLNSPPTQHMLLRWPQQASAMVTRDGSDH